MVLGAVIATVGGLAAANQSKKGAQAAAGAQVESARMGIEAQERATEQLRRDLAPYSSFGSSALGPLAGALGISPSQSFEPGIKATPLIAPNVQVSGAQIAPRPEPVQQGQVGASPAQTALPELSANNQELVNHLTTQIRQKMGGLGDAGSLSGSDIGNMSAEVRGYLETLRQISPDHYNDFINQTTRETQQGILGDALTSQGIPEQTALDAVSGVIPDYQTPQAQQQQQAPSFTPSPFESRAESLMGGSDNPLLKKAISLRQNGGEILQNPLLQAMQSDVTRRLMANQAARGKLGSGGTAESLQQRLIPMALDFREREIGGLSSMGTTLEDLRQREIDQLFRAAGIGQSSAARTGAAGLTGASNIGALQQNLGAAQAQGAMGSALARNQMLGSLAYGAQQFLPQKQPSSTSGLNINPSFNPTVGEIFG